MARSARRECGEAEIFTGLEASNNAISVYLGGGYAFGKGLYEPGWRIRAVEPAATTIRERCSAAPPISATTFDGEASYGAALLGYQFRQHALIVKLFAGIEAEDSGSRRAIPTIRCKARGGD